MHPVTEFVERWHHVTLERYPGPGDHSRVKQLGIKVLNNDIQI